MTERLRAGTIDEFVSKGSLVVKNGRNEICIISDGERFYALDNSCSHMGSQIHRGEIKDGYIVCPWHRARFELASGKSLDLYASDIKSYRVIVDAGVLFVDPVPLSNEQME
ncbi:MAG TPA: Rieske (2Fe-2S) protein [Acidimicrobiales bacterium]|nr:Rieske (2Fe-2S) protein [Acidimicrobiales bacterium]